MKKILAILLALVMTVGLVPAVFADETTYTITINNTNAGHTYEAYQIFKGDLENSKLSNIQWGTGVDEKLITDDVYKSIVTALEGTYESSKTYTAADVANLLEKYTTKNDSHVVAFAKIIGKYLSETHTDTTDSNGSNYVISGLEAGYYLVKDKNASLDGKDDAYTRYILNVTANATVTPKSEKPTIEKKVVDNNDSTTVAPTFENVTADNDITWFDSADHDINDTVYYKVTLTIPAGTLGHYDSYKVVLTDTMSKGLTYSSADNNVVKANGTTVAPENYTIEDKKNESSGETTVTVTFGDFKSWATTYNVDTAKEIKLVWYYECTLNTDAVIGSLGNPNEVYAEYSNNPNGEGMGKTSSDKNIVFTYRVDVNKYADVVGTGNELTGAGFTLYKKVADTTGAYGEDKTLNPDYTLVQGDVYKKIGGEQLGTESHKFNWSGVDDGTYLLRETTTPAGYNTMDDIIFTVSATHDDVSDDPKLTELSGNADDGTAFTVGEYTYTVNNEEKKSSHAVLSADIVNLSGSKLPETGGIGTTIFYVLGGLLAVGAAILLITKKRMTVED